MPPSDRGALDRAARAITKKGRGRGDAESVSWARACGEDARHFSTGSAYVNFMAEDEGDERIHQTYGTNHRRLVELERTGVPTNLYRHDENIRPE